MPESPLRAPRRFSDMESALQVLREGGGRVSASRRAILAVLFSADGPLSAERIAEHATPRLDPASTYRSLEHLEGLGLIRHVHLGHGPGLYELDGGGPLEYALCESCDRAFSFDPSRLDEARALMESAVGIRARFRHFPLVGLCADCSKRSGA